MAVSKAGQFLVDVVDDLELEFVNNRAEGKPFTHYDVSSGNQRVLDLIVSNLGEKHVNIKIDNDIIIIFQTFLVSGGIYGGDLSSTELLVESSSAWVYTGELPSPREGLRGANIDNRVLMTGN